MQQLHLPLSMFVDGTYVVAEPQRQQRRFTGMRLELGVTLC
jgi:hypothetical protein